MKDCVIADDDSQLRDPDSVTYPVSDSRKKPALRSMTDLVKLQGGEYTAVITITLWIEPRYDTYGKEHRNSSEDYHAYPEYASGTKSKYIP